MRGGVAQRVARTIGNAAGSGLRLPLGGVRPMREASPVRAQSILIRGTRRYTPPPTLYLTGAYGEIDLSVGQALGHLVARGWRVLPRRSVLHGLTRAEFEYVGYLDRQNAELAAAFAACDHLGLGPVLDGGGAVVLARDPDGPAAALLPDDVIVAVDGATVRIASDARDLLRRSSTRRGPVCTVLRPFPDESDAGWGPQGVSLDRPLPRADSPFGLRLATHKPRAQLPVDIEFRLDADDSGPSSGLVLALAVLDVLTPGSITGGRRVAGTGTVALDGRVGDVGWVSLKTRAAVRSRVDALLVPAEAEREARAAARSAVQVVAVSHLTDAVRWLTHHGGDPPVRRPGGDGESGLTLPGSPFLDFETPAAQQGGPGGRVQE